jgi:hypothetical protein
MAEIAEERKEKEQEEKDKQKEQDDKDRQERLDKAKEEAEAFLAIMQQTANLIGAINDARFQNEMNQLNKSQQEQLDSFTGTEEEKAKLLEKFAKEKAQLEYRQAKAKKVQAVIDASIGTAVAVATALPNIPLSILAGLMGIAQVAIISATKVPSPQYKYGGVLQGRSHADGGILTPFGELEGGEGVINNKSMANPSLRNLASAANEAGGGVAFGNGQGISLSPSSIAAIINGINSKKVVLNMNELNNTNDQITLIKNESNI